MFQYTSETIINSNVGSLNGKRFAALDKKGAEVSADADSILIDGVVALKAADIKCAYHTAYAPADEAQVELDLSKVTIAAGDIVTVRIYLSEQGRSSSILQNAMLHKNRPFTYSVKAKAAASGSTIAAGVAADLEKQIKAEMLQTDFKFFKATANGAVLTLDGLDCYVRFVDKYGVIVPAGEKIAEMIVVDHNGVETYGDGEVTKFGTEGAGTVAHLIKDLRIPTSASTDPFHGDHGGMPIPGGKYDQYLLEVITERRHVGHNVVGALGASLTSFVFFIESGAKAEFDAMLTAAGVTLNETADDFAAAKRPATQADVDAGRATEPGEEIDNESVTSGDMAVGDLKEKTPAGVGSIG